MGTRADTPSDLLRLCLPFGLLSVPLLQTFLCLSFTKNLGPCLNPERSHFEIFNLLISAKTFFQMSSRRQVPGAAVCICIRERSPYSTTMLWQVPQVMVYIYCRERSHYSTTMLRCDFVTMKWGVGRASDPLDTETILCSRANQRPWHSCKCMEVQINHRWIRIKSPMSVQNLESDLVHSRLPWHSVLLILRKTLESLKSSPHSKRPWWCETASVTCRPSSVNMQPPWC